MRFKNFLFALLALPTLTFGASWIKVNSADDFTGYIDSQSIERSGSIVTYWLLLDYKKPQTTNITSAKYKSVKTKEIIDCEKKELAYEYGAMYSKEMGSGAMIHSTKLSRTFEPIIPESVAKLRFDFLCK